MNKTKIPGVKATRVGPDHEKVVVRHRAVKLELRQGSSLAVLVQGEAHSSFIAGEQPVRITCQDLTRTASDFFDQAIIILTQPLLDEIHIPVPEHEVIPDPDPVRRNKEEHPVLKRRAGGDDDPGRQPSPDQQGGQDNQGNRFLPAAEFPKHFPVSIIRHGFRPHFSAQPLSTR